MFLHSEWFSLLMLVARSVDEDQGGAVDANSTTP
jgi:hypothetical protein